MSLQACLLGSTSAGRNDVQAAIDGSGRVNLICVGILLAGLAHLAGQLLFIALTSYQPKSEDDREWFGRAGGYILLCFTLWTFVSTISLYVPVLTLKTFDMNVLDFHQPDLLQQISHRQLSEDQKVHRAMLLLLIVALLFGASAAMIGKSGQSRAIDYKNDSQTIKLFSFVCSHLFIVTILSLLSVALFYASYKMFGDEKVVTTCGGGYQKFLFSSGHNSIRKLMLSVMGLSIIAIIAGLSININRFSLHAMYRNRLVRSFLGASNLSRNRNRNLFTMFDGDDNILLQQIWTRRDCQPKPGWRPYHIVNASLNVLATSNLAWQERKAEAFVFSPLYCGAPALTRDGAYRPTSDYGGRKYPITLGTAMAISGAALNPNMGYHSSPVVTLIMTLFNLRLGWWLGNPLDEKNSRQEGPSFAIWPMLSELVGYTSDRTGYVNLSDGGHFENLGLYEMIRRRCHFILVCDAGCDLGYNFEDLANATRKIYIDMGVKITFEGLSGLKARSLGNDGINYPRYVIGSIDYKGVDGEEAKNGKIIYFKPSLRGNEPSDVLGYALNSTNFPHEPTTNQWFSKSQFESYRVLGYHIMNEIIKERCGGVMDKFTLF